MTTNPHLEAKIDEIYASGKTIREIIEWVVLKDVEIVRLRGALEEIAYEDYSSWGKSDARDIARFALGIESEGE